MFETFISTTVLSRRRQRQLHGRLPESSRQLVERSTLRGARGKPEQPGAAEPEAGEAEPPRRPESEPT